MVSANLGAAKAAGQGDQRLYWPTPSHDFAKGRAMVDIVQPAASGKPISGLFGCVRNDGRRFHEGIDLPPVRRDRRGNALDPVYAVYPGTVAYISKVAGNSGYGRYVVIEHDIADLPVYTLYAHMNTIDANLHEGQQVQGGTRLGVMGNTAGGYRIPLSQSHVHFEIGLRLSDSFERWYGGQKFGSKNHHGNYNGMNLAGMDPTPFWEAVRGGTFSGFADYVRALPTAFTLRVKAAQIPDFIHRYPALLQAPYPAGGVAGWQIDFTWYGLPKGWVPLGADSFAAAAREGDISLISFSPSLFEGQCRDTLRFNEADPSSVRLGKGIVQELKKIFTF